MKEKIKTNPMGVSDWDKITKEELLESDGNHSFLHYVVLHDHWKKLPHKLKEFSLYQNNDGNNEKIIHLMARIGKVKTIPNDLITHDLLSLKNKGGETVYHFLAHLGYVHHIPQEMWTRNALTLPNDSGETPLHTITKFNSNVIPKDITLDDLLLKNEHGQTPLRSWADSSNWHQIPDKFITQETLNLPHGNITMFDTIIHLYKIDVDNSLHRHRKALENKFKKILRKANDNDIEKLCEDPDPILHNPAKQEASKRKLVRKLSQSEQSLDI